MTDIHPTAVIDKKSQLGQDVTIGPYCVVGPDVTLGDGVKLMGHIFVDGHTSIGKGSTVFPFASLGTQTQDLKYNGATTFVRIGEQTTIREYVTVNSGTNEGEVVQVGDRCHIMAYCHVAHGCVVGNEVIMANCATLAGHVTVEDQVILGGMTGIHQFVRIGRLCITGGCTKVTQDCPPFIMIDGNPGLARGLNQIGLKRRNVGDEAQRTLKEAYRILYRQGLSRGPAIEKIKGELDACPELDALVSFVESSERGIVSGVSRKRRPEESAE